MVGRLRPPLSQSRFHVFTCMREERFQEFACFLNPAQEGEEVIESQLTKQTQRSFELSDRTFRRSHPAPFESRS